MITRMLLTLALLIGANTVVMADDTEDAFAAYDRKDYAAAFEKFKQVASTDCAKCPSLEHFLPAARKDKPGISDVALKEYWSKTYGPIHEKRRTVAIAYLGRMYLEGLGVVKDPLQGVLWLTQAATDDNKLAHSLGLRYYAGLGVVKDDHQAVRWFTKAAEAGNAAAQYMLAKMYFSGKGVLKDPQQAVQWITKAAEAGNSDAQHTLGLMYHGGKDVPQDYTRAAMWSRKAAQQGNIEAQVVIGGMYGTGKGVPQDFVLAHMWANLAAMKESKYQKLRDTIASEMTPTQIAEAQQLAREWKPTTGKAPDRLQDTIESVPTTSATGFVVSRQGHVLTNNHVIEGCRTLRATTEGSTRQVTVVGSDAKNDLAVLRLPVPSSNVARFREGRTIRPGDGVVVVGFPLHGLLASEANVTTGTVSALAGMGNDTRFIQITAPVQPGNSGGPLLDQSGQIVGVVVSKLDTVKIAKVTGDIPQNINFAINGTVAKAFLDASSVEYETSASSKRMESAEIGAAAKKFTLLLECYR